MASCYQNNFVKQVLENVLVRRREECYCVIDLHNRLANTMTTLVQKVLKLNYISNVNDTILKANSNSLPTTGVRWVDPYNPCNVSAIGRYRKPGPFMK